MRILTVTFCSVAVVLLAQSASAQVVKYRAFMDGPSENPSVPSPGTGTALITFDLGSVPPTMQVEAEFQDLVEGTTVAHIHCCVVPPETVGVATYPGTFPDFPVGAISGTYSRVIDMSSTSSYTAGFLTNFGGGTAEGALSALLAGLNAGEGYFNIHTTFSPPGEIRGFLFLVPEPSTAMLAGVAFVGLLFRRRRFQTTP